jgi:hypothetical protein
MSMPSHEEEAGELQEKHRDRPSMLEARGTPLIFGRGRANDAKEEIDHPDC